MLDVGGVPAVDEKHADDGRAGRDQVRRDLLPVRAGRRCEQLDVDSLVLRVRQPEDVLNLPHHVVQRVRHDDDGVVFVHELGGCGGVLDRAG